MQPTLRRTIGRFQYFALGFGTIVGSAWVVVLGEWLQEAGPGGTVIGFLAGGIFMCLIAAVYAELCARMPEAGGEFVFAYRLFGPKVGFFVGWFVTLYLIAITAFEAIVLPWLLQTLWPGLRQAVLYEFLGESVTLDAALIGLAGVMLVTFLNYRDVRLAVIFQSAITYGFVIVALVVLVAGATSGSAVNLQPLFEAGSGQAWWLGSLWIFVNTAFFLNGFQAIPQAIEERSEGTSTTTVARVMIGCVAAGASFYCVVVIFASLSTPWQALAGAPLASAAAVSDVVPGGLLTTVLLLVAAFSLLKTWNAIAFMAARILMAQARQSLLPARFARIHPRYATPATAVLFVGLCTLVGLFLGRGAVLPLVNMASICLAFTFVLACVALWKLRRLEPHKVQKFSVPGGRVTLVIGIAGASAMSCIALIAPLIQRRGVPVEWVLIVCWAALGWLAIPRRRATVSSAAPSR
ncbi:APC family permease [Steroidobacter flavus]|uniref:APC family permease n=1 Tax=Steroidobacter flavus TaxID=1842136 RepID=A0ABV8T0M4_9GAMM